MSIPSFVRTPRRASVTRGCKVRSVRSGAHLVIFCKCILCAVSCAGEVLTPAGLDDAIGHTRDAIILAKKAESAKALAKALAEARPYDPEDPSDGACLQRSSHPRHCRQSCPRNAAPCKGGIDSPILNETALKDFVWATPCVIQAHGDCGATDPSVHRSGWRTRGRTSAHARSVGLQAGAPLLRRPSHIAAPPYAMMPAPPFMPLDDQQSCGTEETPVHMTPSVGLGGDGPVGDVVPVQVAGSKRSASRPLQVQERLVSFSPLSSDDRALLQSVVGTSLDVSLKDGVVAPGAKSGPRRAKYPSSLDGKQQYVASSSKQRQFNPPLATGAADPAASSHTIGWRRKRLARPEHEASGDSFISARVSESGGIV